MVDLSISIPNGFLDEEVRCGYKVTKKMKEVWAVELDLLSKLQSVCKKYNLTVLADAGTLIGAIRHKGFIPWDDDIDVVMSRKDYNVLLSVANKEFQYPYFFQTAYSEKNYIRAHAQLRNSNTTGCIISDLDTSYNKGIFIDIFVADNLPDDRKEREKFLKRVQLRWKLIVSPYFKHKNPMKNIVGKIIGKVYPWSVSYPKFEKLCSTYNDKNTNTISYIAFSRGDERHIWKKEWLDDYHSVPYEFTSIDIPNGYDARLRKQYGDYMKPCKVPTTHGSVIFSTDSPYSKYLENYKTN